MDPVCGVWINTFYVEVTWIASFILLCLFPLIVDLWFPWVASKIETFLFFPVNLKVKQLCESAFTAKSCLRVVLSSDGSSVSDARDDGGESDDHVTGFPPAHS